MTDTSVSLSENPPGTIGCKIQNDKGEFVTKKYVKGRFLGKGGFAKCYEFKDMETKEILAAKIVDKRTLNKGRSRQKLDSEIHIHKSLKHSGIVGFEGSFEDEDNVYIVLELCQNKTLRELVKYRKKLTELEAQCYLGQLIPALIYVHNCNIIHRDIKPRNLFLGRDLELKVGDFGLAAELTNRSERRKTICGTPNYMAPEILRIGKKAEKKGHSFEVDIWAIGIVLYIMLVGKPPFESKSVKQTYKRIYNGQYTIPATANLSQEAIGLIRRILVPTPESRPSLEEIMKDPFMTKNPFPRTMPLQTLTFSPSAEYLSLYFKAEEGVTKKAPQFQMSEMYEAKCDSLLNKSGSMNTKSNNCMGKTCTGTLQQLPGKSLSKKLPTDYTELSRSPMQTVGLPTIVDLCVDYSDQYGVGYALTDGTIGFFYNDKSNLSLLQDQSQYRYWSVHKEGVIVQRYAAKNVPRELGRKLKILSCFKNWHDENRKRYREELTETQEELFVKRVVKVNEGILVKLSNHVVQMCFKDKMYLAVNFKLKLLIVVTKNGDRCVYKMTREFVKAGDEKIVGKLKYMLKIVKFLNSALAQAENFRNKLTFH
eukprot:TRINITY_DN9399_c0_g1_i7.p1 TRINITY_DN9399_c0_g1~~TRINITY_DN9399_c0_g1_i7.p1  ORF type:complete len:595 (-),score=89.53 TRINITY_DN9399_c0_g1_i7:157-1941(-)